MPTLTTSPRSWYQRFLDLAAAAGQDLDRCLSALRARHERRALLKLLAELRARDPRLFEETGVDPGDLPPLEPAGVPLFAQTIIAEHFMGSRR